MTLQTSLCIIGVGGAGGRIVGKAAPDVIGTAQAVAVNTDARELDQAAAPIKLQIGTMRTGGLGAGGAVATGRLAVDDDLPTLREVVAGKELVMCVAGLGGGTGSGALPGLLRAAGEAGALTMAVVTLPFEFEGPRRNAAAREALRAVQEATDTVVVIANDRLMAAVGEAGVKDAFERADTIVGRCVSTLCNLIAQPGYIKLDFADLQQMVKQSGGTCSLAYADGAGPQRAPEAAGALLEGTMLEGGRVLAQAQALLIGIVGGTDLAVREVGDIMRAIQERTGADCHVSMGTFIHEEPRPDVQIVALVSEHWHEAVAAPAREETRANPKSARREPRGRVRESQPMLRLQPSGRGRFRNVEPTILDGEDLDIPTYLRRGIAIEA